MAASTSKELVLDGNPPVDPGSFEPWRRTINVLVFLLVEYYLTYTAPGKYSTVDMPVRNLS